MKELAQNRFARFARIATFFDGAYRVGMTANRAKTGGLAAIAYIVNVPDC